MKKLSQKIIITAGLLAGVGFIGTTMVQAAEDTTINSEIGSVVSLFTTSGTVNIDVTPSVSGAQTIASDTVTVSTNGPGYTLTLANKDANTALESGANTIAAHSGSQTSPSALTNGSWGYRVDGVGGFGAGPTSAATNQPLSATTFAGVPQSSSAATLKDTTSAVSSDVTTVWYSVAADTSQASGLYSDVVTYTAISK